MQTSAPQQGGELPAMTLAIDADALELVIGEDDTVAVTIPRGLVGR